ncbi:hypothetical protein FF098_015915 [Parvularcula flava]|uniref:Uncharacterized protein n=1 Tax=Aquisalinus luteolus TaxID=1566827 RepID=A0A8J3A6A2_9PROT|nr:hypothetical protein [Aquisalinus luteolus]NHK29402.1 hypothetical protein [Aquisalinus luteolus]GGI02058.1 hypothetical protein GCM10011355_34170 [Aquisalinus luteolus]
MTKQKYGADHDPNFTRQLRNHSQGEDAINNHFGNKWDARHGDDLTRAEEETKQADADLRETERQLARAQKTLEGTDRYTRKGHSPEVADGSDTDTAFKNWSIFDRIIVLVALVASIILLALGSTNVATVILASGIPVFVDQPILAWLLAGLVPAAAIALKSAYHLFDLDGSRRVFSLATFGIAGVMVLIWIVLFSLSFEGATPDIDYSNFAADNGTHDNGITALRNIVQILAEVLIGAALFLVIDKIIASYRSNYRTPKEEYLEAEQAVVLWEARLSAARSVANGKKGEFSRLKASRAEYVGEALADWLSQQSSKRS